MKSLILVFAITFSINTLSFATTNNTAKVPPTSHININFLGDLIEEDANTEQGVQLFETQMSQNFLLQVVENNARQEDQAYISDWKHTKVAASFLQDVIEENSNQAK